MKKHKPIICLDIGDAKFSAISLAENHQVLSKAVINSSGIHKGIISDETTFTQELKVLLTKLNEQKNRNIIINIQGKALRTKELAVTKKYLLRKDAISSKIRNDFQKIETPIHKENQLLHYYSAEFQIDNKKITEIRKIIYTDNHYYQKLKRIIKNIGYNLQGAYYPLATIPHSNKSIAIINLGANIIEIALYNGAILREIIQLPLGGDSIINDMMELTRLEKDKALSLLLNYKDIFSTLQNKSIGHSIHHQIIDSRLKEIFNLIKSNLQDKQLTEIILLGGLRNIKLLPNYLGDYLKIPTTSLSAELPHFYISSLQLGLYYQAETK